MKQNGPLASGIDGSAQWAWSLADISGVSVAVDLYATKPNGVTNRPLGGMTAMPGTVAGPRAPSTPVARANAMAMEYVARTVARKPGPGVGSSGKPIMAPPIAAGEPTGPGN